MTLALLNIMSIGILGKKLGMSQFFDEQGLAIPVTLIEAGPCRVTQLKNSETDGYSAVQIGFCSVREKLLNGPQKGHLAKSGKDFLRFFTRISFRGFRRIRTRVFYYG